MKTRTKVQLEMNRLQSMKVLKVQTPHLLRMKANSVMPTAKHVSKHNMTALTNLLRTR